MMISNQKFQAIQELDLSVIKAKLMQVGHGEGWSQAKVNAVETEYRRFLYMAAAFPDERNSPLEDVDTFWHYHILDTRKYAADCQAVFGQFLHHFPYSGLRGNEDAAAHEAACERMRVLYEETFGVSYAASAESMKQVGQDDHATITGLLKTSDIRLDLGRTVAKPALKTHDITGVALAFCMVDGGGSKQAKSAFCMVESGTQAKSAFCMAERERPPRAEVHQRREPRHL
jgi:hypothetical protein